MIHRRLPSNKGGNRCLTSDTAAEACTFDEPHQSRRNIGVPIDDDLRYVAVFNTGGNRKDGDLGAGRFEPFL